MGINRPSLYAAFGNKEQLFPQGARPLPKRAYVVPDRGVAQATARAVVEAIFLGVRQDAARPRQARGCLIVSGALASARRQSNFAELAN